MTTTPNEFLPVLWKRLDVPGTESCRIVATDIGYDLVGAATFADEGLVCQLAYHVCCDNCWRTLTATVIGWSGACNVNLQIERFATGQWRLNGAAVPAVDACIDVDLNFSPATNLLPIRRLKLAIGESATVSAAWLQFPNFQLARLDQTYTRLSPRRYRYESGGFSAELTVDDDSLVIDYGAIWSRIVIE